MSEHGIIYERGTEAVCACGAVLSIYGRIATFAGELGAHIRAAREAERAVTEAT